MKWRLTALVLLLLATIATAAHADEIRLKDGSKIIGTIVAFQGGSFKIRTSYGFAMVRKDSIAAIIPSGADKPAAAQPATNKTGNAAREPANAASGAAETQPSPAAVRAMGPMKPPRPLMRQTPAPATAPAMATTASATSRATSPAIPNEAASTPPPPPAPPPVRELVRGELYINETYGFQMYRPPDWEVIPGARQALPDAVAALGTDDQTTLLVIGRSPANQPLEAQAASTESKLREIYENYRPVSSDHLKVSGLPAVGRKFRGSADGHDWWVSVVTVERGKDAFTILGMTTSESDLIQIQENVIGRVIASLKFSPAA